MLRGHENRSPGQQVVRMPKGQENRTSETIHWLTCIHIDVDVLHLAVIMLQLIYSAVNVKIAHLLNCIWFLP